MSNVNTFAVTATTDVAILTAAKTTYNDTTNAQQLSAAGSNGSKITQVRAAPRATVTATQLQLFLVRSSTVYFLGFALMSAYTMAQTTVPPSTAFTHSDGITISEDNPLYLSSGDTVYTGAGVALSGGIVVAATRKDY